MFFYAFEYINFISSICFIGKDYCAEKGSCGECTADPQCGWCGNKCMYIDATTPGQGTGGAASASAPAPAPTSCSFVNDTDCNTSPRISHTLLLLTLDCVSCPRLLVDCDRSSFVRHKQNCPACSRSKSCDSCIKQPDCGWCYSTGTCTSVANYDVEVCPAEEKGSGNQPRPLIQFI